MLLPASPQIGIAPAKPALGGIGFDTWRSCLVGIPAVRSYGGFGAVDVVGVLVFAESEEDGVAELTVAGHLGEAELGDDLRVEPRHVARARGVEEG